MDLFDELRKEGKLTGSLVVKFQQKYGDLFYRSLELLQNNAVSIHKNIFFPSQLVVWSIQGHSGYYLIYPEVFCQCQNFLIEYIYRRQTFGYCKHLFAQKLAENLSIFQENRFKDKEFASWIKKFLP